MGIKEDTDKFIDQIGMDPSSKGDEVEEAIQETIKSLTESGYDEEEAEKMVFESLAHLIESDIISDTPDPHMSYQIKEAWIQDYNHHIAVHLEEMGVPFE